MAQSQLQQMIAVPGQLLGPSNKYVAGPGTHIHESNLYASLLGTVAVSQPPSSTSSKPTTTAGLAKRLHRIQAVLQSPSPTDKSSNGATTLPTISVAPPSGGAVGGSNEKREVLPEVHDVVLCRVTRIAPKQATVAILVVGDAVLEAEWQGVVRVQDVRATEKDRVRIYESFRPGDIVRAQVISLGDQANYYLSTASNELGVIMATSEAGNTMYPVSWKEYKDPETGLSESRKVAKPM
ncbi:Uu.00g093560.m01.CDS01 [Anthostomella pinea]|uniref:Uu.00g093560.m01.CDS01 n=1 Tax=Anthostomella pinea TaxID=933095 RepID=A0AAI8VPN7_9PEZI|nr:Uu.00g093560.m01.CDS01 [Anthostomella pinea]